MRTIISLPLLLSPDRLLPDSRLSTPCDRLTPIRTAQLNVNQSSGESKKVMVRHPECEQPVMFVVPQIKIVPGPAHVRDRLQSNRATFVSLHSSMQELARTFATHAALIELLARSMHLDVSFRKVRATRDRAN